MKKHARRALGQVLDYGLEPPSRATVRAAYRKWRVTQGTAYWCDIESCALHIPEPIWKGQRLVLTLDHIDGNSKNNRPSNLRLLCPNCDSQLPTRGGRNMGRVRHPTVDSYQLVERDGTHEVKVMLRGLEARAETGFVGVEVR